MSLSLPFYQVDVFTAKVYKGNPVAVVVALDPSLTLSEESMAQFANWTNLSETTFILPPTDQTQADYKLRIFTTSNELPFAGHPTIGSCKAFLAAGGKPRTKGKIVQECGLGLIQLRLDPDETISFIAPKLRRTGPVDDDTIKSACQAMHISTQDVQRAEWIVNGPDWFALQLKDAKAVLAVETDGLKATDPDLMWGIWGAYEQGKGPEGADFEVRTFCDRGRTEDPVTGSFTAGLAVSGCSLVDKDNYIISQGTKLGRSGKIHVDHQSTEVIWIGGHATVCITGKVTF